jgi:hypothetical protein
MSSLIFQTEDGQALVATDTLAVSPDGRPFKFTTKAFIMPHLRMIIAGTGAAEFVCKWFTGVNSGFIVRGIDNLDYHAPRNLSAMWQGYKQEPSFPEGATVTIYHFGFSEETGLIHSFAYRSTDDFRSDPIGYGLHVKPECLEIPADYCLPRDIRKMMDSQRIIQASRPKDQRVYIGGEIEVNHLSKDGFHTYVLDRFDDYASDERAVFENFNASKR